MRVINDSQVIEPAPDAALPVRAFSTEGYPWDDLPAGGCKFSVTPHLSRHHLFCGAPREEGRPYCRAHVDLSYTVPAVRQMRPRRDWDRNIQPARRA